MWAVWAVWAVWVAWAAWAAWASQGMVWHHLDCPRTIVSHGTCHQRHTRTRVSRVDQQDQSPTADTVVVERHPRRAYTYAHHYTHCQSDNSNLASRLEWGEHQLLHWRSGWGHCCSHRCGHLHCCSQGQERCGCRLFIRFAPEPQASGFRRRTRATPAGATNGMYYITASAGSAHQTATSDHYS